MFVKEILREKGDEVYTIQSSATLADVVEELVARNCGSLVVFERNEMVGIITERDILRACAGHNSSMQEVPLRSVMHVDLVTITPNDKAGEVMRLMTEHRIRHLPVMDDGRLVGLVSIGDVVKAHYTELTTENQFLKEYIRS